MSRSQFYCKAVEAFLKAHRNHGIKNALDAVYGGEDSRLDSVLAAMQDASLQPEDWRKHRGRVEVRYGGRRCLDP